MSRSALAHRRPERIACIDLPDLPMQILLRDHPGWRDAPAAVVESTRPQGAILAVNARARRAGVRTGMRYGSARNLVPELRGAQVTAARVTAVIDELAVALQTFSPRVEASSRAPGTFWLDPEGLGEIYGSVRAWAESVHKYLQGRGFHASVVVGFGRYGTHAIARTRPGAQVIPTPEREAALAGQVEIARLAIAPEVRDGLEALGVRTLADVARLPATELESRFGIEARRLHDEAVESAHVPVQRREHIEPVESSVAVDPPDADLSRLLFGVKGALHALVSKTVHRGLSIAALEVQLDPERGDPHVERIEPAMPTRDEMILLDLVRLRLGGITLAAPIEKIVLRAEGVRTKADQLSLFATKPKRDLRAASRALARLRAAHGPEAVTRAKLEPAHLPEAQFRYEPLASVAATESRPARPLENPPLAKAEPPPMVRQMLARPRALGHGEHPDPGPDHGQIVRLFGPYRVSGGWWQRTVERDYYYAETERGDLLWLFFDRARKRWFLHGIVD